MINKIIVHMYGIYGSSKCGKTLKGIRGRDPLEFTHQWEKVTCKECLKKAPENRLT